MDKDENHKRNNHHLGMGQDIYHKKKLLAFYLLAMEANIATQQMWKRSWKSL
jgi:hypothetical protein